MDLSLSEEQVMLRDSVEKYVTENCSVDRHRALCAEQRGFDEQTWRQFAELGWLAVPFAEELGGIGGGATELMVMAEALGKGLVREPFLHTVVTCGGLLERAGSAAQQGAHIPGIIDGSTQWALAFAEDNASYDLALISAMVEGGSAADYQGATLNGSKLAVLNGDAADYLVVTALTGEEQVSLFIVDANSTGVQREKFVAVDGSCGAHITFTDVVLGPDCLLGEAGRGQHLLQSAMDFAMVTIGGEALGAMQSLLQATVEYTKTRQQFGQPISNFQVLQHRMADMYMKVEETRSLLLHAAILLDEHSPEAAEACAALKVKVSDAGRFVSQQAVQLHGGIGMTDELVVGHHYKRLLLLDKLYGDENHYLQRYIDLAVQRAA